MNIASTWSRTVLRASLILTESAREPGLSEALRHIDDTLTTLDGLYTQLALVAMGEIREACTYEQDARQYLKDFYYAAIHAVSHKETGEDYSMSTFDRYPFVSQTHPLFEFNRESLERYSVSLQPLALSSIRTGSISIDLLGVGKILEFIEHAVKQVRWEAQHERELAKRSAHMVSLEEQLLGQRIVEAQLTNEEKKLSIASRKIELLEEIRDLDLPRKQKRELVRSVVGKADLVQGMADVKVIRKGPALTRVIESPRDRPNGLN